MRRRLAAVAALATCAVGGSTGTGADRTSRSQAAVRAEPGRDVAVQVLAINDFHGALEAAPDLTWDGEPAGGIEYLASHVRRERAENPRRTAVVSAGDLVGASPLLSAHFHDEPTVEAMNLLGLDFGAVGNHEFDEGSPEMLRLARGGCHPDGCLDGTGFGGADFGLLSANVRRRGTDRTLLPPFRIERFGDVKVAFVGMTLENTPGVVSPGGTDGLEFADEAETVNALVPALRRRGAQTVVALLHEGGAHTGGEDDCEGISGQVVDVVERTSDEVDLFVTGHTHEAYDCVVDGRPVTSAGSSGRLLTDIDLTIDRRTGEPRRIATDNRVVTRDVAPDRAQTRLVDRYRRLVAPLAERVLGRAEEDLTRELADENESLLGNLVADAQLAATAPADVASADVAFVNQGSLRAELPAGDVTYGEAFAAQPFGHALVSMTLTGAQIERLLEQQRFAAESSGRRMLSASAGLRYAYSLDRRAGDRVLSASIELEGREVHPAGRYRVTVNSFLAAGGDGYSVLTEGEAPQVGGTDLDALERHLTGGGGVTPPARDRVTRVG